MDEESVYQQNLAKMRMKRYKLLDKALILQRRIREELENPPNIKDQTLNDILQDCIEENMEKELKDFVYMAAKYTGVVVRDDLEFSDDSDDLNDSEDSEDQDDQEDPDQDDQEDQDPDDQEDPDQEDSNDQEDPEDPNVDNNESIKN